MRCDGIILRDVGFVIMKSKGEKKKKKKTSGNYTF